MEYRRFKETFQSRILWKTHRNSKPIVEEIDAPLILDLIEGLYLLENKKLQ